MRPIRVVVGPLTAALANNISQSQTPSAGALLLNGTTAGVLDHARQVLFTFAADETGHNFVVTGTDINNSVISETVAGRTAGTVATVLSYLTVTSIVISANATGAIIVGTNGVASSMWVRFDEWSQPEIAIQCTASGTVNYTVQQTLDDPNSPTYTVLPAAVTWINHPDSNLVAATGSVQGNYAYMPVFARVVLNSGSGTVTATFLQSANVQE